ncbi:hypothetical protein IQ07DRAFT_593081 [Pyrenochaeta sp. DS3sAY3a]|nr:hypothetical protein IQ07DRAFT_593081 [Pyrenochaeta sp. DS3sAY3a]
MRLQIPTLVSSFVLAIAAQNNSNVDYNFICSSFVPKDPERYNYTLPSATTHRVSTGVFCPSTNDTCWITASGRINVNATTNLTEITNTTALYSMLKGTLEGTGYRHDAARLRMSLTDWVFQGTSKVFPVSPGQAGYVGFTPEMRCYDGILAGMTPDCRATNEESVRRTADTFDRRAIRICVPTLVKQGKLSRVKGELATVTISREQAESEDMDSNPAMPERQTPPPDEVVDNTPDERPRTGDGGRVRVGIAASALCGLAVVMTLM